MQNSKYIQNFMFQIDRGEDIDCYSADAEIFYSIDENYGADADGRRGERRVFIEDIAIDIIRNIDGNTIYKTQELIDKAVSEIYDRAKELIND